MVEYNIAKIVGAILMFIGAGVVGVFITLKIREILDQNKQQKKKEPPKKDSL